MRASALTFRCAVCLLALIDGVSASRGAPVKHPVPGAHVVPAKGPGLGFGAAAGKHPVAGVAARPGAVTAGAGGPEGRTGSLFPVVKPRGKRPVAAGPLQMQAFVNQASQLGPAVVSVMSWHMVDEGGQRRRSREQGTGFIVNPQGYILTNNHVVEHAAELRVRLQDERELSAQLIGRDERTDIALLKIDAGPAPLAFSQLGNSDEIRIGEWVMAIGNPFGLDHTVTLGIVSAKGRREVQPGNGQGFFDFLQTDASINPGNSGGPLVSTRGEVIGINTAINAVGSGIGFAIPSNIARAVAEQLYQRGRVLRSWLGVYPQAVTESLRKSFQLPDRSGALLAEIYDSSPAAQAGLQIGDVVVEFNGKPVRRADDLMWLLGLNERRTVELRVFRGGTARTLTVQFPLPTPEPPPAPAPARALPTALGLTVSELTPSLARQIGYEDGPGLVIMTIEPGSPAMDANVERGDIVLRVGEKKVVSLEDYARAMREIERGQLIRLLVRREERKQWHNLWVAFIRR